jgi:outer membrane protein assembly factor BamD
MEESAEAQNRICEIHYKEMDRSDRDDTQALRAQDECKQLLVQYPNSKFAPKAAQMLRNIQESLAEHEFVVGNFYWKREMHPAAANRLNGLVDQYPLFSKADEALYEAGDSYSKMGPRFRKTAGEEFARIVQEYPLGARAEEAKSRLEDMEMPVPQVDPSALARMKFEEENYKGSSLMARSIGWVHSGPDVAHAAKEGSPTMTSMKKTIPASVPIVANAEATASANGPGATGTTDVSATTVGANSALDQNADARTSANETAAPQTPANNNNSTAPLPSNRQKDIDRMQKERAKKQAALQKKAKKKHKDDSDQEATPAAASSTPAVSTASPTGNQLAAPGAATSPAQAQPVPSATTPTSPAAPQQ